MSQIITNRIATRNRLAEEARTMRTFFWPLPIRERNTLVQQFLQRANPGSLNPHRVLEEAQSLTDHAQVIQQSTRTQEFTPEEYALMQDELTSLHNQAAELEAWAKRELATEWVLQNDPSITHATSN